MQSAKVATAMRFAHDFTAISLFLPACPVDTSPHAANTRS
jgi:hypothetical protein